MGLYSSIGFIALSMGVFAFVRAEENRQGVPGLGVFPVPALFGAVTLIAFLWLASAARERQRVEEMTDFRLGALQQQIETNILEHVQGIIGIAQRQGVSKNLGEPPPARDLEFFQNYHPAFRALGWADSHLQISWGVWEAGLHLPTAVIIEKHLAQALSIARAKGTTIVIPTFDAQSRGYLIVAAPCSLDGKGGGMVVGIIDVAQVFSPITRSYLLRDYSVLISAGQAPIFRTPGASEASLLFARIRSLPNERSGLECDS